MEYPGGLNFGGQFEFSWISVNFMSCQLFTLFTQLCLITPPPKKNPQKHIKKENISVLQSCDWPYWLAVLEHNIETTCTLKTLLLSWCSIFCPTVMIFNKYCIHFWKYNRCSWWCCTPNVGLHSIFLSLVLSATFWQCPAISLALNPVLIHRLRRADLDGICSKLPQRKRNGVPTVQTGEAG